MDPEGTKKLLHLKSRKSSSDVDPVPASSADLRSLRRARTVPGLHVSIPPLSPADTTAWEEYDSLVWHPGQVKLCFRPETTSDRKSYHSKASIVLFNVNVECGLQHLGRQTRPVLLVCTMTQPTWERDRQHETSASSPGLPSSQRSRRLKATCLQRLLLLQH